MSLTAGATFADWADWALNVPALLLLSLTCGSYLSATQNKRKGRARERGFELASAYAKIRAHATR